MDSWRPLAVAAAGGAAILVIYLIHPVLSEFRLPIGPDGPVYTWLGRLAEARGFLDAPGGGPGIPALTSFIDSVFRTEPIESVTLLGPVLAAATGLAAGALLEATLGRDSIRTLAAVLLTGAFAAYLAGGWLANVAMVAVFLAALVVLSLASASNGALWSGAALLAGAGLAHQIFISIGAAILLMAAGWRVLRGMRSSADTSPGLRLGMAAIGGPGAALLAGAWIASGPRLPGDTSQDGFFRRTGLRALLLDRYRERFLGDAARAAIPIGAGAGVAVPWISSDHASSERELYLRDVLFSWAAVTMAGLVVLLLTTWGPPYRLIQFAFFLPVAAAAGLAILLRGSQLRAFAAAALGTAFVAASMVGWFRQTPAMSPEEIAVVAAANTTISATEPGTPLLFLVDTKEKAAAYHVARAANVIKTAIPPGRIPDVRIVVGTPEDLLAGIPSTTGDREHDRIATTYLREAEPLIDRAAILVVEPFNQEGFEDAADGGNLVAPGVAVLNGVASAASAGSANTPTGLSPAALFLLSVACLALLAVSGWGWARWMLTSAGAHAVALTAPSVGIAVAILGTVAADRVGLLPGSAGSLVINAALAITGYVLAARR